MSLFGLDAESVLARTHSLSATPRIPTLTESLLVGSAGFCLVSGLVFTTVAFGEQWLFSHLGVAGSYGLWTLLFVLGGGAVLRRLVVGPISLVRFYALFLLAFLAYALLWIISYFAAKGLAGEWIGSLAGSVLLGLVLCGSFSAFESVARVVPALLAGNVTGYFLGRLVWRWAGGSAGMIGWGIIYGLGFGLGLGYAFYACQGKVRAGLKSKP